MTQPDQTTAEATIDEQIAIVWDAVGILQNLAKVLTSSAVPGMDTIPVAPLWRDLPGPMRLLFKTLMPGWLGPISGAVSFVEHIRAGVTE